MPRHFPACIYNSLAPPKQGSGYHFPSPGYGNRNRRVAGNSIPLLRRCQRRDDRPSPALCLWQRGILLLAHSVLGGYYTDQATELRLGGLQEE